MSAPTSSSPRVWPSAARPAAASTPELKLGGITPFTTIDYPGRLAAVLYTQGCAWRCRYCHNSHLWPFSAETGLSFAQALAFLENRKGLLDAVVFCGGEPTAHPGLPGAMRTVKAMGFLAGLHTTGMHAESFREALPLCDWVGMDVKAPFRLYSKITRIPDSGHAVPESVDRLLASGVEHEFRMTVHPALLSEDEILEAARDLRGRGARTFVLQAFRPGGCGDETLQAAGLGEPAVSARLRTALSALFPHFLVRE